MIPPFAIGDKVVCVSKHKGPKRHRPGLNYTGPIPVIGQVYVVRDIWNDLIQGVPGWLIQMTGFPEVVYRGHRKGWGAYRFRKLTEIQAENAARARKAEPSTV